MADNVKITFEIDGIQQSVSSVDELKEALQNVEAQSKKTEKTLDDTADAAKDLGKQASKAGENGEAGIKVLDEATGGLATKVKEVGGGLKTLGGNAIKAFKGAVAGASAMSKALIATGIGAIVVALGLIVAYWDDIVGAISGVSAEQEQLLADTEAEVAARQESLDATSAQENSLKLSGMSEKEIRDLKIQQTEEVINAMEAQLILQKEQADAQVKAQERNKGIAQNVIRFLTLPITLLLKTVDMMTAAISKIPGIDISTNLEEGFSGGLANMLFDPEETAAEGAATVAETEKQLAALKNKRDGYILQNQAADKAAKDKAAEERAKATEEEKAELDRKAAEDKARKDKEAAEEIARKKALDEALLILDEEKMIADAENMFERARVEFEIAEKKALDELTLLGATEEQKQKIIDKYAAKRKKLDKEEEKFKKQIATAEKDAAIDVAGQAFDAISALAGESSAIGKAAAVASTIINTYKGAQSAFADTPGGIVIKSIAAGVAVTAGLMNIKKILSTKTPGGGGVRGGGGALPTAPAIPTFDPTAALDAAQDTQTGSNEITLGDQEGSSGATVVKAYVVSSDMTSQQEADAKITSLARL